MSAKELPGGANGAAGNGAAGAESGAWDAVLFDLDGTLADTVEMILLCYRHTMRAHLGRELPDSRWLATIGTPLRDQLREFARTDGEARAMLDTYVAHQDEIHDRHIRAFPGAVETVEAFSRAGMPLAVVTSKQRRAAHRTLEGCGLDHAFETVVTCTDVRKAKPHPEPVLRALDHLGMRDPRRVLFVGDSPYDVRAGRGAGTRTAGALWGPYPREALEAVEPDFLVEDVQEVAGLTFR